VIDPENLERSSRFNPFTEARNEIEIEQIAEILIHSGSPRQGGGYKALFSTPLPR